MPAKKSYIGSVNHLEISAKFTRSLSAVLNPARCIHLKLSKVLFLSLRSGSLGHCGAGARRAADLVRSQWSFTAPWQAMLRPQRLLLDNLVEHSKYIWLLFSDYVKVTQKHFVIRTAAFHKVCHQPSPPSPSEIQPLLSTCVISVNYKCRRAAVAYIAHTTWSISRIVV